MRACAALTGVHSPAPTKAAGRQFGHVVPTPKCQSSADLCFHSAGRYPKTFRWTFRARKAPPTATTLSTVAICGCMWGRGILAFSRQNLIAESGPRRSCRRTASQRPWRRSQQACEPMWCMIFYSRTPVSLAHQVERTFLVLFDSAPPVSPRSRTSS